MSSKMLNSNMVITDCSNIKEANESINNNDTNRAKTKAWPKGTCVVTGSSMLGHIDET